MLIPIDREDLLMMEIRLRSKISARKFHEAEEVLLDIQNTISSAPVIGSMSYLYYEVPVLELVYEAPGGVRRWHIEMTERGWLVNDMQYQSFKNEFSLVEIEDSLLGILSNVNA